jgi:hypothetical protein
LSSNKTSSIEEALETWKKSKAQSSLDKENAIKEDSKDNKVAVPAANDNNSSGTTKPIPPPKIELKQTHCSDSLMISIFKATFWVSSTGRHPAPGQIITHNDVTQFAWCPTDHHYTDFCRYVTLKLENEGCPLRVRNDDRKLLFICDPQNDFCDNIPALINVDNLVILDESQTAFETSGTAPAEKDFGVSKDSGVNMSTVLTVDERQKFEIGQWQTAINKKRVANKEDLSRSRSGLLVGLKMRINRDGDGHACCGGFYAEVQWTHRESPCNVIVDQGEFALAAGDSNAAIFSHLFTSNGGNSSSSARGMQHIKSKSFWKTVIHRAVPVRIRSGGDIGVVLRLLDENDREVNLSAGDSDVVNEQAKAEILWNVKTNQINYRRNYRGGLATTGSFDDFQRTSKLISANPGEYDEIYISRDCHRFHHIAHQPFWCDSNGSLIDFFKRVRYIDVMSGRYRAHPDYRHYQVATIRIIHV